MIVQDVVSDPRQREHELLYKEEYQPHFRGFDHYLGFLTGGADFYTHEKCFRKKEGLERAKICGYDFREASGT